MPAGSCVIRYGGARGVTWRIKFLDADGRQVKETLGREPEWDRRKAERALGARLAAVEKGLRKPPRRTFADLAAEFDAVTLAAKPRKKSTLLDYRGMLRNHLRPTFDTHDLQRLSQSPEAFDRYTADKIAAGLSPKTVANHLRLLGLMFKTARRWRWVAENPIELVDPPPADEAETETLTPEEIADLLAAYRRLSSVVEAEERWWYDVARRMTVVALSTGLRRGELLGLTWETVELLEGRLRVAQAFVRGEMTTPKSRAGRRTLQLGAQATAALEEQYQSTRYRAPECVVFCHPALGTPLDPTKLTTYVRKALTAAGITKRFRPWHGQRHTALTETAAAGVPGMFVQAKAGHAQGSTTERYLHASRTSYPDAAELAEARLFNHPTERKVSAT